MLAKRIIPCLDVTGGRVVKGVNFVELRDAGEPVEIAARYNEQGADELTFLDITATSDARDMILHIIEAVASQVFIPLTVGGGVRTVDDVRRLLNAGADKTSFNSAAIANPDVIADASAKYGAQCIVVAIDAKRRTAEDAKRLVNGKVIGAGWDVYSHGGRQNTGLDAVTWAKEMAERGAGEILLTSMDKDGTKSGFDLELTRSSHQAVWVIWMIWPMASFKAAPMLCWRPAFFTMVNTQSRKPNSAWQSGEYLFGFDCLQSKHATISKLVR